MRYEFKNEGVLNVLHYKVSNNKKLGIGEAMLGTYHFSIDQIKAIDLMQDAACCFDCAYSNNSGDGSCYTQRGMQRWGLISMMKAINKRLDTIKEFNLDDFLLFFNKVRDLAPTLTRFGVYGEPVLLPFIAVKMLSELSIEHTGYTHRWILPKYAHYKSHFMASTHSQEGANLAIQLGWRVFNTGKIKQAINCPASKEAQRKTTCAKCGLCSGTSGKGKTNIYINKH